MLSKLFRKNKTNSYNQHFKANMNNIKNSWKERKSITNIKNLSSDIPKVLPSNGFIITNQVEIANVFNNYFAKVVAKAKENIKPSLKHFLDFPKKRDKNSFFLNPTSNIFN